MTERGAQKAREPDEDCGPTCEICRDRLRRDRRIGWYCQRCDDAAEGERAMRAAWEEWIKEQP